MAEALRQVGVRPRPAGRRRGRPPAAGRAARAAPGCRSRRARSACRCARVRRPVSMSKSRLRAAARPDPHGAVGVAQRLLRVRCTFGHRHGGPVPRPPGRNSSIRGASPESAAAGAKASTSCRGRPAKLPTRDPARRRGREGPVTKLRRTPSAGGSPSPPSGPSPFCCPSPPGVCAISAARGSSCWRTPEQATAPSVRCRAWGAASNVRSRSSAGSPPGCRASAVRALRGTPGVRSVHADRRFMLRSTTDAPATPSTTLDTLRGAVGAETRRRRPPPTSR